MKLTLLTDHEITSQALPEKCAGQYEIKWRNKDGKMAAVAYAEGSRGSGGGAGQWILKPSRGFALVGDHDKSVPTALILPYNLYTIVEISSSMRCALYVEPLTDDRKTYQGYELAKDTAVLRIGRKSSSSIWRKCTLVSNDQAELEITPSRIFIKDIRSRNGTYVNGKKLESGSLRPGDVIYVMGLQIIVTNRAIFLNNPDGDVTVQDSQLVERHAPFKFKVREDDDFEDPPEDFYRRAPRIKQEIVTLDLKVDPPPSKPDAEELPMIMAIGPAMTMGMASLASGGFAVASALGRGDIGSAMPSIVMSVSMLLGTMMWPMITKRYQRNMKEKKEDLRQRAYKDYIAELVERVNQEMNRQENLLRRNDEPSSALASRILAPSPLIWERTPKHSDFLTLRLGSGSLPLNADIKKQERKFAVAKDELVELMLHFSETKWWLSKVPICLSVVERFVSGIAATRTDRMPLAKSLILQIAGRHCYDEVKLCLVLGEKDIEELDFCWWLPHVFSDDKTVRYIATNYAESKELSSVLGGIFETRKEMSESKLEDENPYYVIICLDKDLAAKTEVVRRVLDCKKNIKFSVLSMFESLVDLPKECSAVVEVGASGSLTLIGEGSGQPMTFNLDELNNIDYDRIAAVLANNSVPSRSTYSLPSKYTFFEMIDLGMIEHLNLLESWASHDPTESLAVPVGVDSHGDLLNLNLHEKAHGPHGLVAGMTGSGKSEFIMAYILSLAVSFHPYEVAFILIDYKGGGMAKPFENIPHTAGIITNLDGNGIKRSLASLKSELHRRERIFENASSASHTSNIDIYKYQKLYREGKVREPLPHLIIISDEFAELKKEQGEFMTELTSASRVGRSLGVHLILATQKPEGVVDDQINSNSRFRVCLKVQDTADSNAMLGHPDAAMLQGSGKFFLRVGIDEIYEAGQSAWAGAPYYPSQKTVKDRDDAITVIDTNGHPVAQANTNRFAHVANPEKQLDTVINYIKKSCKEEGIKTWKMWLDPIPPSIFVDDLSKSREIVKYKLDPVAGMYDDPGTQSQGVLTVPVSSGNTIVYGSQGSGKLMFIEAVCYSLAKDHFPDESNIYILDFDQETLTAFSDAPHVGDVILSHESEKVVNLLKLMVGKVSTRKKILSKFGGTLAQYNASAEKPEPSILVIINNYAAFSEIYEASLPEIAFLSREGPKYGITFLLACTGINNVKLQILQNFKNLYCLQLNSADEYSSVVGKTEGLTPEMLKGRGLVRLDGRKVVEFQTARATKEDPPNAFFKRFSKHLSSKYPGAAARRIPVLPEKVTEEFLASRVSVADIAKVPIAVEKATLDILSWNFATPVTLIMSLNQEWLDFTRCLATMASSRLGIRTIVLQPSADKPLKSSGKLEAYTTPESLVSVVKELFSLCLTRNNEYKDKLKEGKKPPTFEKVLVIIQSMSLLKASLELVKIPAAEMGAADDSHVNRLMMAMEKNAEAYGVYYVVAESSGKMRNHAIDKWNTIHAKATTGLWVGSGINSQYKFTISKKPTEYTQELPVGFGFSVINSTAVLVKFLESE